MVAAMNAPQMNNGANPNLNPLCGKYITVKGPKGSVRVKIVDTCPPCAKGDIDLSVGAFGKVGSYIDGRIPITWEWS
ncbi:RlpA-like double-psi beta-barrel-protein domain-containing protein-containing protein [Choanephora cucurbitarum]|nr:RlpA-like double-psi beta-barrel-protein domain-containing protein-containing protein [Choanephora cucurbitarum]